MAHSVDTEYKETADALRPSFRWPDGRPRAAHSEVLRPLRPACVAVQGQPKRHVLADQSESKLRGVRFLAAGNADQDDPRSLGLGPITLRGTDAGQDRYGDNRTDLADVRPSRPRESRRSGLSLINRPPLRRT